MCHALLRAFDPPIESLKLVLELKCSSDRRETFGALAERMPREEWQGLKEIRCDGRGWWGTTTEGRGFLALCEERGVAVPRT